ncbi:citrate synthase [Alphaproteobacteria bacterium]|nr:citrate synthase [Alphaproteobacteria bacterium]MDB9825464.1 citrate synthase [Alphaproteobacteria bacterium]
MSKKRFTLIDNDNKKEYQLDGMEGSIGPDVINISSLYKDTGLFTYDPGFTSTAACNSKITYIDGEKGVLLYRGYPIEQLANNSSFLEVSYLLMHGELPSQPDKIEFENTIKNHTLLNEQITHFFRGFRRDAHPMAMMIGVVGALSAFYHDSLNIEDPEHRMISTHRILAKMPTIAAMAFKYHLGEPFMYPLDKYDYTDNFLHMSFATPTKQYEINPLFSKIMDQILILHADHEQNASTSTVRTAGSSLANPYACISAGISSLWGKSHGGANEAVVDMIQEIKNNDLNPKDFIEEVKNKKNKIRLMGFGHRVYKNYDPRAKVLKKSTEDLFKELKIKSKELEIAKEIEELALNDEYFKDKNLYPNVDFYSGILLKALGIPTTMFTPIFAVGRTIGWLSQWKEMIEDQEFKITRPRQLYTGEINKNYKKVIEREKKSIFNLLWLKKTFLNNQ